MKKTLIMPTFVYETTFFLCGTSKTNRIIKINNKQMSEELLMFMMHKTS